MKYSKSTQIPPDIRYLEAGLPAEVVAARSRRALGPDSLAPEARNGVAPGRRGAPWSPEDEGFVQNHLGKVSLADIGQVAAMHNLPGGSGDVTGHIYAGRLPAVRYANWRVLRSDAEARHFKIGRASQSKKEKVMHENTRPEFAVLGIDLALLNTGVVMVDRHGRIECAETVQIGSAKDETAKIARLTNWNRQAEAVFVLALRLAARTRGNDTPLYIVYESRPFLSGKQKQGRQSIQSVLSFGKALALMRLALGSAITRCENEIPIELGAVSPQWWRARLLGNGPPIGGRLLEQAESLLTEAKTPKRGLTKKAAVLAAVQLRTGVWVDDDHQADAAGLALAVADHLVFYGIDGWAEVVDSRYRW